MKLSRKEKAEAFEAIKWGVAELSESKTVSKKEREFYKTVLFKIGAVEESIVSRRRKWFGR